METKITRNEILDMMANAALANVRFEQEKIRQEMDKINFITEDEYKELLQVAIPRGTDRPFYSYARNQLLNFTVQVPIHVQPSWLTERSKKFNELQDKADALGSRIESLRSKGRTSAVSKLLEESAEGKTILGLIKKLSVVLSEPVAGNT